MNKYRYKLCNFHAIQEADLLINGITVLSGINGCGKSTLSRWLYYVINGVVKYEDFLFQEYTDTLVQLVDRMLFVCRDMARYNGYNGMSEKDEITSLSEISDKLANIHSFSKEQHDIVKILFYQALKITSDFLFLQFNNKKPSPRIDRVLNFLHIDVENGNYTEAFEAFTAKNQRLFDQITVTLEKNITKRPKDVFFRTLNKIYDLNNDIPSFIQLDEDNVSVIDDIHISNLYNLKDAIYIDTPMSITSDSTDNKFWERLRHMIVQDQAQDKGIEERKLLLRIKHLLDGEVVMDDTDFFSENSLRYISSDKEVNIELNDVATGFKTFSYLQRLIENGYLNDETLLMIDEPEAHLHPQWIVEFARLLVLLNKKIGLKIILASHNPDMVAAIHDIANKEGVLDNTNFYVADTVSGNNHKFIYKNLGQDIEEIFKSFNIALERINNYGRSDFC